MLSASVAATAVWSYVLLGRASRWEPWLRPTVLVAGLSAAAGVWGWRYLRGHAKLVLAAVAAFGLLAGPGAYTMDTVNTPHSGAIPTAGPTTLASFGGGPGAFGGTGRSAGGRGLPGGAPGSGAGSGLGGAGGGPGGAQPQGGPGPASGTGGAGGAFSSRAGVGGSIGGGAPQAGGGTAGGLLDASKPSTALVSLLSKDASRYKWVAATVGSNPAAGYQLATRGPVMALGSFNGTDPYPTLAEFERLVRAHEVHYFVASSGTGPGGGGAAGGTGSSAASAITAWVESNFQAETVGGATVYDLLRQR